MKLNISKLNIYDLQIIWWTPEYSWGYDKTYYDCKQHWFNIKLFAICWVRI